jgi:putative colanic acid biosynthesis UDP-glucose lipid carrier transferase
MGSVSAVRKAAKNPWMPTSRVAWQLWRTPKRVKPSAGASAFPIREWRNDGRVTPLGSVLRRTSIDELPQLWNVVRGEMSLVGPRPHPVALDNRYDELIANYADRHHVKPGITGWAQVNGYRGETPNVATMEARVMRDVWYINNWSLWLDIRILIRTILIVPYDEKAY